MKCPKCGSRNVRKRMNYPFGKKSNRRVTYQCKHCKYDFIDYKPKEEVMSWKK